MNIAPQIFIRLLVLIPLSCNAATNIVIHDKALQINPLSSVRISTASLLDKVPYDIKCHIRSESATIIGNKASNTVIDDIFINGRFGTNDVVIKSRDYANAKLKPGDNEIILTHVIKSENDEGRALNFEFKNLDDSVVPVLQNCIATPTV